MKPCPHCGATADGFYMRGQVSGPAEIVFQSDGRYREAHTDYSRITRYGAVRCGKCNKIRRDVEYSGNQIIEVEAHNENRSE